MKEEKLELYYGVVVLRRLNAPKGQPKVAYVSEVAAAPSQGEALRLAVSDAHSKFCEADGWQKIQMDMKLVPNNLIAALDLGPKEERPKMRMSAEKKLEFVMGIAKQLVTAIDMVDISDREIQADEEPVLSLPTLNFFGATHK